MVLQTYWQSEQACNVNKYVMSIEWFTSWKLLKYMSSSKTRWLTLSLSVLHWANDNTSLPLDINISKTVWVNIAFIKTFSKEYSISFLMVCRLIDFAIVIFELLVFKVCGIIGISKIEFFNFSGTERVKQYQKNLKTIENLLGL